MSCHITPTRRELDILKLIAMGNRNSEIATTLHITVHTVETHLSNIYSKLAIRTRTEAARWYWEYSQKQSAPLYLHHADSASR
jgi:DNA-binding NarL/FixJ family response regulator